MKDDDFEKVQKAAMCGDRMAVLTLVSALRMYRDSVKLLNTARYRDGECDGTKMHSFISEIEDAELLFNDWRDSQ